MKISSGRPSMTSASLIVRIHEAQFHGFAAKRPHVVLGGAQDRRPCILFGSLEKCRDSTVGKLRHRFSFGVQQARKVINDVIPEQVVFERHQISVDGFLGRLDGNDQACDQAVRLVVPE